MVQPPAPAAVDKSQTSAVVPSCWRCNTGMMLDAAATVSPLADPGQGRPTPAEAALTAFVQMVQGTAGFRVRPGQEAMARQIADRLSDVDLGEHAEPRRAIAVIQAGTGVGKSAAYASTMLALALAHKTRLVISTATVALQEQLMTKDLPALAAVMPVPFVFALAKGRGRYVCKLKLERLTVGATDDAEDELFGPDDDTPPPVSAFTRQLGGDDPQARRLRLYASLSAALAGGRWDGDRDSLPEPPEPRDWASVAAERHTCTARHCPRYRDCSYYQARSRLAEAHVIVANHDLVLASVGMKTLPELDNCLVVFDEGHHLPAVALNQFASVMDLSNLRWLDKLPKALREISAKIYRATGQDVDTLAQQLRGGLNELSRLLMDRMSPPAAGQDSLYRLPGGALPPELQAPLRLIQGHAAGLSAELEALGAEIKRMAREDPSLAQPLALMYARLGQLAPRLQGVAHTSALLLAQGEPPLAKWFRADTSSGLVVLTAHACPIVPGDLLRQHLWRQVRAAVITSASLTSCGSFDYFLQEAGLADQAQVSTLAVQSPFDYARQGRLVVVDTVTDPRDAAAYTRELVAELLADLRQVAHGALALFTSRAQMRAALDALDATLLPRVLVQGQLSRSSLLAAHQARVEAGQPSVIFGLQSFGEGLDLPGALCETVFIAKLPFSPPADPVEEARAEWLRSLGRDPFTELVVPATGIRLLQWTGRAIRSEDDQATVICYDKRLLQQGYGRRMLQGLPPYAVSRRAAAPILAA